MWNRSILIGRTSIVWIFWIKLSGSNYLDQIIWIKLSGSNYLDQTIWIKLSGLNCLDQIIWFRLFGSNYFEYYESFWIILNYFHINFYINFLIKFMLIFISIYPLFNANYWSLNPDKNPLILINFKENFENVPTFQLYLHV